MSRSAQFVAATCFLSFLTLKKNSVQSRMKAVKEMTWNERPATMMFVPVFSVAIVDAPSAIAPPADCKTKAMKSEQINVMV